MNISDGFIKLQILTTYSKLIALGVAPDVLQHIKDNADYKKFRKYTNIEELKQAVKNYYKKRFKNITGQKLDIRGI